MIVWSAKVIMYGKLDVPSRMEEFKKVFFVFGLDRFQSNIFMRVDRMF